MACSSSHTYSFCSFRTLRLYHLRSILVIITPIFENTSSLTQGES